MPEAGARVPTTGGRRVLAALLLASLAVAGSAAGRAEQRPGIVLDPAGEQAISPDGDGVRDALSLDVARRDGAGRPAVAVELAVYGGPAGPAGELVARERVELDARRSLLARLPFVGARADLLPLRIEWAGTFGRFPARPASGAVAAGPDRPAGARVPDGAYLYQVTVFDARGASSSTAPMTVVVDTEPPRIDSLSVDYPAFSPNGDGVRDTLPVRLSGSSEAAWTLRILRSDGEPVREYSFAQTAPQPVVWDGRGPGGDPVPDGAYRVVLTGIDRAGNRAVSEPVEIAVGRRAREVRLRSATPVVSPNGDGLLDRAALSVDLDEPTRVASWRLLVTGPGGTRWTAARGEGAPPAGFSFDARDRLGRVVADASYRLSLEATWRDGSVARSEAVAVRVDTRGPSGVLVAQTLPRPTPPDAPRVFGAGARERLRVSAELDPGEWTAVLSYDGRTERVELDRLGLHAHEPSIVWDGTLPDGRAAPDGVFELVLVARDDAGNAGSTNTLRVTRDTRAGSAGLFADRTAFSPNGDGVADRVDFRLTAQRREAIEAVTIEITDADGRPVRVESISASRRSFAWGGRADAGGAAPDGTYRARVEVAWRNGARAVAVSAPVALDTTPPAIEELASPYRLFSPNGDGVRDTVTIAQSTSSERLWTGAVVDRRGDTFFERRWRGAASSFVWDGRDADRRVVPDGDYTYELCATDAAGNTACADLPLVVDTTSLPVSRQPPAVALSAGPSPFTPDGDGTDDVLTFVIGAEGPNELRSWSITITDASGTPLRTFGGAGDPPSRLAWDGRTAVGELVRGGEHYFATLEVVDVHGNAAEADTRVRVGILVERDDGSLRITMPHITFQPAESDPLAGSEAERRRNLEALRGLAEVLRRYPDREILIEGHAARDEREEGPNGTREQREDLVLLSAERARAVRRALVILGVEDERMTTVGVGAARPVVPHADHEGIWKNRRVEFILKQR